MDICLAKRDTVRYVHSAILKQQRRKKRTVQSEVDIEEALFHEDIKPVCGWIVCVSGPRQGKDYKVVSGKNFIGRADDMNIQILGDNEISRRNHAVIVFDPKKKETVLLPEIPMDWFI